MTLVGAQAKPALTAVEEHRANVDLVDEDRKLGTARQVDLVYTNLELAPAAVIFILRKACR